MDREQDEIPISQQAPIGEAGESTYDSPLDDAPEPAVESSEIRTPEIPSGEAPSAPAPVEPAPAEEDTTVLEPEQPEPSSEEQPTRPATENPGSVAQPEPAQQAGAAPEVKKEEPVEAPAQNPEVTPVVSKKPQVTEKPTTPKKPNKPIQPKTPGVPAAVAALTPKELKAAAALYAKTNQKSLSRKGVQARQRVAQENLNAITAYVAKHSPTTNASIARALNLPPRRVAHYIQTLTRRGTVTATGWAQSRRYFKT